MTGVHSNTPITQCKWHINHQVLKAQAGRSHGQVAQMPVVPIAATLARLSQPALHRFKGSPLWPTGRKSTDSDLAYRWPCRYAHHLQVDSRNTVAPLWDTPERWWWRPILPGVRSSCSVPGCTFSLEGQMAILQSDTNSWTVANGWAGWSRT